MTDSGIVAQSIETRYRAALRQAARGLWKGVLDVDQFYDAAFAAVNRFIELAWYDGARECGIQPSELTVGERHALQLAKSAEMNRIGNFASYVEQNSEANGGALAAVRSRADLWALRAKDVSNKSKVMACKDQKLMWELGATEVHCSTCAKLHRKVKRASYWERIGVRPQNPPNPLLECGGWKCDCRFTVTDAPLSKGPLPRLP